MMTMQVLGSSSSGNCYILSNEAEALIIEAGVKMADVKAALGFNLRKVCGCIVSHAHNDHAKFARKMADNGFPVLALPEVLDAKGIVGSRAIPLVFGKGYKFGGFRVKPFEALHDVPCAGFLIAHAEIGRVLFLTDSCLCRYSFPGLTHIMMETNYSDPRLVEAITEGRTRQSQRDRLMTSHMELFNAIDAIKANNLSDVREIVILHLSDNNSNEAEFVRTVQAATALPTYAAKPGLSLDFTIAKTI